MSDSTSPHRPSGSGGVPPSPADVRSAKTPSPRTSASFAGVEPAETVTANTFATAPAMERKAAAVLSSAVPVAGEDERAGAAPPVFNVSRKTTVRSPGGPPVSKIHAPVAPAPRPPKPGRRRGRVESGDASATREAGKASDARRSMGSLMVSVLLHAGLIGLAVVLVVSRYYVRPPETVFTPPPRVVKLPAQIREQALSAAKHDAAAPRPGYGKRVAASVPSPVAVPKMPEVNLGQMLPLDPGELVSDQIAGMIGASGYGRGTGTGLAGGGGAGGGSGMAFFNLKDTAKSVVILLDVSQSMFSRTGDYDSGSRKLLRRGEEQAFHVIRREAIKLIDGLGPDTRFNVIRWSGSARCWKPELVPATDANKAEAREHVLNVVDANSAPPAGGRPGGTRHDYALEELFRLAPETAFMLTDGNATRSTGRGGVEPIPAKEIMDLIDAAAKNSAALPRVNTIYYLTGADRKEEEELLRGIARKTKGKFRKVEAATVGGAKEKRRGRGGA